MGITTCANVAPAITTRQQNDKNARTQRDRLTLCPKRVKDGVVADDFCRHGFSFAFE
jgi:hypothetical protein